jgi:DNA-directed RNA polymerase specialized sigma24 family protein
MGRIQEVTGSIAIECERRLSNLFVESHNWLLSVSLQLTKNRELSEDLVCELYEYLHLKQNPKLWWGDNSYNLGYCSKFLKHRFFNKAKKLNKVFHTDNPIDSNEPEIPYDEDRDRKMAEAYDEIIRELKRLEGTRMCPQSKLFQIYWFSDKTLDEVSKDIKISKSTTFLAVKKIRKYLESVIENPFNES